MGKTDTNDSNCPYCNALFDKVVSKHQLKPGTILANRYVVGYALGEGGFGITYIGMDERLGMKVAIKEYYPTGMVTRIEMKVKELEGKIEKTSVEALKKYYGDEKSDAIIVLQKKCTNILSPKQL